MAHRSNPTISPILSRRAAQSSVFVPLQWGQQSLLSRVARRRVPQDNIRLKSNLTVNLGLRYDFNGPFSEKYGRLANSSRTHTSTTPPQTRQQPGIWSRATTRRWGPRASPIPRRRASSGASAPESALRGARIRQEPHSACGIRAFTTIAANTSLISRPVAGPAAPADPSASRCIAVRKPGESQLHRNSGRSLWLGASARAEQS